LLAALLLASSHLAIPIFHLSQLLTAFPSLRLVCLRETR
jgi:hypothetical protein